LWPSTPLLLVSFCAVAFQLALAAFWLPVTEQFQLLPTAEPVVLPRLLSVSPRSKQYDHCASALALPSAM